MLRFICTLGVAVIAVSGCSAHVSGPGPDLQAVVLGAGDGTLPAEGKVWVCHQNRWQEVGQPAGAAHQRHGDAVSEGARVGGGQC